MKNFKNELSLRQFSFEDAKLRLEKYLDDAYLLGISPTYILHGKGKGTLRDEVRKLLNNILYIKSFRSADVSEGGIGVTVVYLKNNYSFLFFTFFSKFIY
jgi:DNA mismatch repair protein MutS2